MTSSSPATRSPACTAAAASPASSSGAGASTSVQMPSVCTVSTTGHAAAWPDGLRARSTASSRTERHPLLEQQTGALGCRPLQPVGELTGIRHDLHALAVVAAARRLGDDRPAHGVAEGGDLGRGVGPRPPRARDAERGEPLAHRELVLGEAQRLRARVQLDPLGDEQVEHVVGHVLVVEGDDVAVLGEGVHGRRPRCGRRPVSSARRARRWRRRPRRTRSGSPPARRRARRTCGRAGHHR